MQRLLDGFEVSHESKETPLLPEGGFCFVYSFSVKFVGLTKEKLSVLAEKTLQKSNVGATLT